MKLLKQGLTIRGDAAYCPLSLSLDSYGNCLTDCWHCYLRNLNHVWGQDLKPLDIENFERQLTNGLLNKRPKTPLAWALHHKKALRFGNKADPFETAELTYRTSLEVLNILWKKKWFAVIQTMHTSNMMEYEFNLVTMKDQIIVQPIISCGLEKDWQLLERERTTKPIMRLEDAEWLAKKGVNVAVNGEPFIPGFHTVQDFENMMKLLVRYKIKRYNIYNFHFNAFVAKRLHAIGVDIEAIWFHNQDKQWKPILQKLIDKAKFYDIILGCPDFVNAGIDYKQGCNTCCGVDVPNPTTWNTHTWIRMIQEGYTTDQIIRATWDGVGDREQGIKILTGESDKFYSIADAKKKTGMIL